MTSLRHRNKDQHINENTPVAATETKSSVGRAQAYENFKKEFSLWHFVDPSKPWVMVPNGSMLGFFDFTPYHWRNGPWSIIGSTVCAMILVTYVYSVYTWTQTIGRGDSGGSWWSNEFYIDQDDYYEPFTYEWYYNIFGFCWTIYISWNIMTKSPLGIYAWMTFTVWSWTILMIRHGLCVIVPFLRLPGSAKHAIRTVVEALRFPTLLSATITTVIWNFVLGPMILFGFLKDEKQRKKFIEYFANFRMTNLHVFNIVLAIMNDGSIFVSNKRMLRDSDLVVGSFFILMYLFWYYLILDRLGIHLYAIFSPRTPFVGLYWITAVALCFGFHRFWKSILPNSGP